MKWYAKNAGGGHQGLVIDEADGRTVAVSYDPKDAALLAAAPDLLAALQALMFVMNRDDDGDYFICSEAKSDIAAAREAIAKATGQQ